MKQVKKLESLKEVFPEKMFERTNISKAKRFSYLDEEGVRVVCDVVEEPVGEERTIFTNYMKNSNGEIRFFSAILNF